MPKLSIIVPVYNVEAYLQDCIDSILNQTFTDFELILIDDGSPDRCGKICDDYAEKDSRVIVIHQENKGVSAARNAGLDIAKGDYIGFVDSDDIIEIEMYSIMMRTAMLKNVDMVVCGIKYVSENGQFIREELMSEHVYESSVELLETLFGMPNPLAGAIWNKIYKADIIKTIRFQAGARMAEDLLFLFDAYRVLSTCVKISPTLYLIRERNHSVTRKKDVGIIYESFVKRRYSLLKKARNHSLRIESCATDKYLNDCIVGAKELVEAGQLGQNYRIRLFLLKVRMIRVIIRSYIFGIIPKSKLHGYLCDSMHH